MGIKDKAITMELMTKKQENYLYDLVCMILKDEGDLYITGVSNGRGSGELIPVMIPKDYKYEINFLDEIGKREAMETIALLVKGEMEKVSDETAGKIQLDGQEITLREYKQGQRVIVGIEID